MDKLSSLRGAYESLESWSNRWRTDAETKLLRLKQVGESALKGAKAYRQNRDDLVRELAALKSALRSFLTTLWGDLQSRPCLMATLATEAGRSTQAGTRQVSAEDTCMPFREVLMNSAGSAAGFVMDALATEKAVDIPILPRCEASVPEAHEEDPPSAELTEGEISDMMNALSAECSTSFASFTGAAPTGEAKDGSEFKVLGSATSATHGVGAGRQSSPLDHDDAGFCARVESALGGRDSSPTLAKVLLSMRSQQ